MLKESKPKELFKLQNKMKNISIFDKKWKKAWTIT